MNKYALIRALANSNGFLDIGACEGRKGSVPVNPVPIYNIQSLNNGKQEGQNI